MLRRRVTPTKATNHGTFSIPCVGNKAVRLEHDGSMGVANDFSQLLPVADWLRAVTPTGGARLLNSQAQLHGNGHLYPATDVIVTTFGGQFGNKGGTATNVYHKRAASYTGIRGCLLVVHVAVCIFRDTSLGKGTPLQLPKRQKAHLGLPISTISSPPPTPAL